MKSDISRSSSIVCTTPGHGMLRPAFFIRRARQFSMQTSLLFLIDTTHHDRFGRLRRQLNTWSFYGKGGEKDKGLTYLLGWLIRAPRSTAWSWANSGSLSPKRTTAQTPSLCVISNRFEWLIRTKDSRVAILKFVPGWHRKTKQTKWIHKFKIHDEYGDWFVLFFFF